MNYLNPALKLNVRRGVSTMLLLCPLSMTQILFVKQKLKNSQGGILKGVLILYKLKSKTIGHYLSFWFKLKFWMMTENKNYSWMLGEIF